MRIKIIIFALFFCLLNICYADGPKKMPLVNEQLKKKYPHSMLTPDYGIITDGDLAQENKHYNMRAYGAGDYSVAYWICVPTKSVKNIYETWRDSDPWSGSNKPIVTLCSLSTIINNKQVGIHKYYGRRAQYVSYCRDFVKKWKQLTRNEPIVCLSGEAGGTETELENGSSTTFKWWTWNKFRTRKGCYAYFNNCEP